LRRGGRGGNIWAVRQAGSGLKTCSHERDELVKEIEKTDTAIDNLVYDLYGLTDEERRLVEGNVK